MFLKNEDSGSISMIVVVIRWCERTKEPCYQGSREMEQDSQ